MMRPMILLLALLLLSTETIMAHGAVWHGKRVIVNDYTSAAYKPYVREMVAAFNAMLPARAPKLVYRSRHERSCHDFSARIKGAIAICTGAHDDFTGYGVERGAFTWAVINLIGNDAPEFRHSIICHEMMHAITDAPEAEGYPYEYPNLDTSCVTGATDFPGAWDIAYARKVYRRHR